MSLFIDNYRCIVYNNKHKDDVEVMCRMGRKSVAVLPQTQAILEQLGEQIKLARLRRHALNNMDKDLLLVAKDDELGRKLQDLELTTRKRAPRNGGD